MLNYETATKGKSCLAFIELVQIHGRLVNVPVEARRNARLQQITSQAILCLSPDNVGYCCISPDTLNMQIYIDLEFVSCQRSAKHFPARPVYYLFNCNRPSSVTRRYLIDLLQPVTLRPRDVTRHATGLQSTRATQALLRPGHTGLCGRIVHLSRHTHDEIVDHNNKVITASGN